MRKLFIGIAFMLALIPASNAQLLSVTPTHTPTHTETFTPTVTDTYTDTTTFTETFTPTASPTYTHSPTSTHTPTHTRTFTPTFTYTNTHVPRRLWGSSKDLKQIANEAYDDDTQSFNVQMSDAVTVAGGATEAKQDVQIAQGVTIMAKLDLQLSQGASILSEIITSRISLVNIDADTSTLIDQGVTIIGQLQATGASATNVQGAAADGQPVQNGISIALEDGSGNAETWASDNNNRGVVARQMGVGDGSPSSYGGGLVDKGNLVVYPITYNMVHNGTSWDKERGTAANGTWSHIKAVDVPVTVYVEPNLVDHENKNAEYTTTQSGTTLWTPAGGKKIVLYGVWASSADAGAQVWVDGSTFGRVVPKANLTADGGYVIPMGSCPVWVGAADETLDISTSVGDPDVNILLIGYER